MRKLIAATPFHIKQREQNIEIFLDRIRSLSGNVKGFYKNVCLENTKEFAFEIAQQANANKISKEGAIKTVGKAIVKLALRIFPDVTAEDTFKSYVPKYTPISVVKKPAKKVVRIATYPIEIIFDFIKNNPDADYYVDPDGNKCKLRRAKVFYNKGITCVSCPNTASFFALEQWMVDKAYHFDLFAIDLEGDEVLMTVDHIHAKSKGGPDFMENYQPMCVVCNYVKSDN